MSKGNTNTDHLPVTKAQIKSVEQFGLKIKPTMTRGQLKRLRELEAGANGYMRSFWFELFGNIPHGESYPGCKPVPINIDQHNMLSFRIAARHTELARRMLAIENMRDAKANEIFRQLNGDDVSWFGCRPNLTHDATYLQVKDIIQETFPGCLSKKGDVSKSWLSRLLRR